MHPIFVPVKVSYGSKSTAPLCGNLLAPVPNGGKRPSSRVLSLAGALPKPDLKGTFSEETGSDLQPPRPPRPWFALFPSHSLPVLACSGSRCPWVSYSRSLLQSDAQAKLRLGLSRPTALCKVQKSTRHFSNKKFSNKFVQNPIPLPPTTSSRSERGWQTQRERETSLGVPRLALRGECCGWGASASRRGRRRGSVGRAPAPPGPRRLPVASSRPSQDPAGRNQPRPRCPAGPPPRRGRPWCGGTS